jgi:fatty-acyl-CoA synthase
MQGTMMNYPLTLAHILERAGRIFPEQEIVSRLPDRSLHRCTYADMYRRARRLAEALQKAGLKRGDRVATLMWNHFAHVEAYLGIPVSGGVMHTLNLRLAPREIAYMANHAEDRFLIVDDSLLPLYEQIREATRFERVFVVALGKHAIPPGRKATKTFSPRPAVISRIRGSTRTKLRPCAIPRAQPGCPRASRTRIAPFSCTHSF